MANKSDYRDPRTNLFELLPEVFQSQTNESVFEDVFNRYLSKPQIELVDGFAGEPFNNAVQQRQIVEPTPHRQAFQLQPLLFAQVGSVNHLASYVDILNEIGRLGIEQCRLPLWGNTLKFNWSPPIDIDKLVNFRDYFWCNTDDAADPPQYITIENPCIEATQRVEAFQETIDTFGDLQAVVGLGTNSITIADDLTGVFTEGYVLFVTNSTNTSINSTFFTTVSSSYDSTLDRTTIVVSETISNTTTIDGDISFDVYLQVLQSQQQCACGDDVGWDIAPWDDNQVGTVLWSAGLLSVISQPTEAGWLAAVTASGATVGSPIVLPGSPAIPADLSIWYDTTTNQLKQFLGSGSPMWQVVQNNFSVIVALVEGTHFWDFTSTCNVETNPWTEENNWFHKNHVPSFSTAKQAQLPIIEYDFDAQLNRWTFTDYVWKYRESDSFSFAVSAIDPTLNELIPFKYVINSIGSPGPVALNQITISPEYGDQTSVFVDGYQFRIENDSLDANNNATYTVASSSYTATTTTPGAELATVIIVDELFSSANQSTSSLGSPVIAGSGGRMVPQRTALGDAYQQQHEHWLLDDSTPGVEPATGKLLPVASPPPTTNPFVAVNFLTQPVTVPGVGEYITSTPVDLEDSYGTAEFVLTMQYTVLPTIAPGGVEAGQVIPLDPRMIFKAPIGESVVRVSIRRADETLDQQLYGTFTELDTGVNYHGSPIFSGSPETPGSPVQGSPRVGPNDGFVDSILLSSALNEFDTLTITVAEQSVEDMGRGAVAVRTVESDTAFAATGSPLGSQPETVSLVQFRKIDPLKSDTNEYPLFDVLDCEGNSLFIANPLFKWKEDQDNDLNTDIGLRIVGTTTANFEFENLLIDTDTLPRPVLYTYVSGGAIQTIWRKGINNEEYVPSYVNSTGVTGSPAIPVEGGGSPASLAGFWEIPDQLYFNAEHENRQFVTFPEFFTHFESILDEQTDFPGVILSGSQSYLLQDYNYGLGGRIKEHNDSYDTFLSSTFVNNVSPLGVIDFAHDQYENSLNIIKELYRRNLSTFLTDTTLSSLLDLQSFVEDSVITAYELNDFFAFVYGDTNTFIAGSPEIGVKNWPATLPFVGLGFKSQPHIIEDDDLSLLQLIHHDGHRSNPSITTATRESIIQVLLITPDARVPGETHGVQQSAGPPDQYSVLSALITPRPGIYWYDISSTPRVLYRFVVTAVSATAPSGVPVGSLWYDTANDLLMELQSDLTWLETESSPQDGVITSAWEVIDFDDLLINTQLEVEERLFASALTGIGSPALDFNVNSVFTSDVSCPSESTTRTDSVTATTYLNEAFSDFLRDVDIDDAFSADQFFVATDPFTWNYSLSTITTSPRVGSPSGVTKGWWLSLYQELYGTPYPHLEPWALQGFTSKPTWWDTQYKVDPDNATDVARYGTRRWRYIHGVGSPLAGSPFGSPVSGSPIPPVGMWENIRTGIVPTGQSLPSGTTSTGAAGETQTWNYFSVNIDNTTIDGFDPDDVFPPFWNFTANGGTELIRSVFSSLGEIVLSNADYTFDSGGPICFQWISSSQRLYDDLTVSFRMQPVRFIHSVFGVNFLTVADLQVNALDCKVYSHRDVLFHGDIIADSPPVVVSVDGINQWYVNFNRFNGFDVAASDFRQLWQNWEPLLTYQFGSIIDTQTLQIDNSSFDITERDYQIILKKSPGIDDFFVDAFNVKVLESPNKLARFDTQSLWKLQISTFFPTTRSLSYFEVHDYPVRPDELTNTFHLYEYDIADVDVSGIFFLDGDQTDGFTTSLNFTVTSSTGNDGTYTAASVSFNSATNRTTVTIAGGSPPSLPNGVADGFLATSYRTHPWETGDKIELTSTQTVPAPLVANIEYFVIKINNTTFQLASTLVDAQTQRNINISSVGVGQIHAGQVFSKFVAGDGLATNREWVHFLIDTRFTRTFVPPHRVTGIQNLINIIDGYAVILSEDGWTVNLDSLEPDPDSGQPISWALETERFIDQAFRLPQQRAAIPNTYPVSFDQVADTLTFTSTAPNYQTGQKVNVSGGTGSLPSPLLQNQTYYVIRVGSPTTNTFQLALSATDALLNIALDIIGGGSASINVFETPTSSTRNPSIEINPFRNNIWLNTPQGILSNIVDGPTDDIRNTQLITDQAGNQLTGEDISVFRFDKVARVYVPNPIANLTVPQADVTPYNTIHIASVQAFVDGYESVIVFNDDATDGTLIYDPFVGLNTQRFSLRFFRQDEFTQRPVVGGYFLTPDDEILRNIEAGVLDLQNLYDTNQVLETTPLILEGRKTLGFKTQEQDFLDEIGLNPKSKFLFWRGMIQNKGSVKAVDAFTKSVKFDDAVVDEFWTYKVADFGTNYQQEYPGLNLVIEDSRRSEKRFEFLRPGQTEAAQTFEGILLTDQTRWFNQPDVLEVLDDNNDSFFFDTEVTTVEVFESAPLGFGSPIGSPLTYYIETTVPFDDVVILKVDTSATPDTIIDSPLVQGSPTSAGDFTIINSRLIEFSTDPVNILAPDPFVLAHTRQSPFGPGSPGSGSPLPGSPKVLDASQYTSDNDITTWSQVSLDSITPSIHMSTRRGLAYNGTTWVSVGFGIGILGSPNNKYQVLFSNDDGASWTEGQVPAGFINTLQDVAANNDIFVAVAGTAILSSTDGITWTARTSNVLTSLNHVHWSGEEFVAVGAISDIDLAHSSDGITWTPVEIITPATGFNAATSTNNGARWFGGENTSGDVYVSDDKGITWTEKTTLTTNLGLRIDGMASNGVDTVVAVGLGTVGTANLITSADNGETWTRVDFDAVGSPQLAENLSTVIYVPGYGFVAGGNNPNNGAVIITSTDGLTWTRQVSEPDTLTGLFVDALASKFITGGRELRLYTINPAKDKQNPSKVIDVKDDRVVNELPIWDPIRSHQYHVGNNLVTFESDVDPASYTDALDNLKEDTEFWNTPEVGITWWDTAQRGYVPYNDSNIFELDDRIQNWGKLAEWADVKLYQWTKSNILPSAWDAVAAIEELDISIDPLIRKTGQAKAETFQRERVALDIVQVYPSTTNTITTGSPSVGSPQNPTNTIIVDDTNGILALNDRIVFTTDDELPLPIQNGVFYFIISINNTIPALTEITISETNGGSEFAIKPGATIIDINGEGSPEVTPIGLNPTGLINDFDTSGIQTVTFSTSKTLGSATGLTLGTQGSQEVDFENGAITGGTATGLDDDIGGSQTISWVGSPIFENCAATPAGLLPSVGHAIQVSVDGAAATLIYFFGAGAISTFSTLAATISTALSGRATAVCTNGAGIVVTSNSTGPLSSILITDGPGGGFGTNLISSISTPPGPASRDAAVPGTTAPNFEAIVAINGANQNLDINGGDAQTFTELISQMNLQLFGAATTITDGNLRITSNETGVSSIISITDTDLFSSMNVGGGSPQAGQIQTAVDGTSVSYQTTVAVDGGGEQDIIITGDDAQTFTELLNVLNNNITGAAVSLLSSVLRITSSSTGSNSTIDLLEVGSPPGLFFNLNDVIFPFPSPTDGVDATTYTTEIDVENGARLITVIGNEAQNWTNFLSEVNSQLPTGALSFITRGSPESIDLLLDAGNNTVTITNDNLFTRLGATSLGSPDNANTNGLFFNEFIPQDTGDGNHQVIPPFSDTAWIQLENMTKDLISARDNNGSDQFDATIQLGSPQVIPNVIAAADEVDVYINGVAATGLGSPQFTTTVTAAGLVTISGTNPQDFITLRKKKHIITDEEADFDPDVFDDGSNLIQFKSDHNFSTTFVVNDLSVQVPVYYFWVENKTIREGDNITMRQAVSDLETIPTPYMIIDNLLPELFGSPNVGSPLFVDAPRRYTQLILRGLAGIVDDVDRYVLRFTRDFTLRDSLNTRNYTTDLTTDFLRVGAEPLDLKSHHTEWTLIREKQSSNIPRVLWDKITESMIASKLTDPTSRVPSLSRELYDVNFGTDTRYGLGDEQAFVDGVLAKATLIDDLQDADNDFSPIDINTFFAAHDFDTSAGLVTAMNDIYNTFSFTSVNRIFFKILLDAFTTKQKYADIFKTSWVALSGTQVFQTEELFTG